MIFKQYIDNKIPFCREAYEFNTNFNASGEIWNVNLQIKYAQEYLTLDKIARKKPGQMTK